MALSLQARLAAARRSCSARSGRRATARRGALAAGAARRSEARRAAAAGRAEPRGPHRPPRPTSAGAPAPRTRAAGEEVQPGRRPDDPRKKTSDPPCRSRGPTRARPVRFCASRPRSLRRRRRPRRPAPGDVASSGRLPPPPPTPTPRPPEITFKFIGTFGPKEHPIAVDPAGRPGLNVRDGRHALRQVHPAQGGLRVHRRRVRRVSGNGDAPARESRHEKREACGESGRGRD